MTNRRSKNSNGLTQASQLGTLAPQMGKHRVLIADDDLAFAKALEEKLVAQGTSVELASCASKALLVIEHWRPDGVVLEPNLPGGLWYPLLHDVRTLAPSSEIIVVTAFPSRALLRAARSLGVASTLTKPVSHEAFFLAWSTNDSVMQSPKFHSQPSLARLEWEYINHILHRCDGNVAKASRRLGVPRQTLYRKLRKYPPPY